MDESNARDTLQFRFHMVSLISDRMMLQGSNPSTSHGGRGLDTLNILLRLLRDFVVLKLASIFILAESVKLTHKAGRDKQWIM